MTMVKKTKKALFVEAMHNNLGNVTASCKAIGISRRTYYNWIEDDPEFKEDIDAVAEELLDMAENTLLSKIESGDTTSTIFYLKTKGKKRNYIERVEKTLQGDKDNPLFIPKDIADKL